MKVQVLSYGASRQGGIEEVTRQVLSVLGREEGVVVRFLKWNPGRITSLLSVLRFLCLLGMGYSPMVMHPYIFERIALFKKMLGFKTVVWAYGIDVWGNYGKRKAPSLPLADVVVTISNYTKERLEENFPNINGRIISLTIDAVGSGDIPREYSNELLTVGRLSTGEKYKGHDLVIKALAILKSKGITPIYHVVGKGDDMPRLVELSERLGLSGQVRFHGYVPDEEIGRLYSTASVFVMPSFVRKSADGVWGGEGFGLVYLEAGLHKMPVIACNEGGQTDCIIDGVTGYLVDPDENIIADKLEYLLSHPEVARALGEAGCAHVKSNFSPSKFKNEILHLVKMEFD